MARINHCLTPENRYNLNINYINSSRSRIKKAIKYRQESINYSHLAVSSSGSALPPLLALLDLSQPSFGVRPCQFLGGRSIKVLCRGTGGDFPPGLGSVLHGVKRPFLPKQGLFSLVDKLK